MNFEALDSMFKTMDTTEALEGMESAKTLTDAAEAIIAHITQEHPGFSETQIHIARQWCRVVFSIGAAESIRRDSCARHADEGRLDWLDQNMQLRAGAEGYDEFIWYRSPQSIHIREAIDRNNP